MCEQETALEAIKIQPRNGGLSKNMILLAEKQCKDYKKMEMRMNNLEKKVDLLDHKMDQMRNMVDEKLDRVLTLVEERRDVWQILKSILNNKVFIYLIITLLCAAFGVSVGEVGTFLFRN